MSATILDMGKAKSIILAVPLVLVGCSAGNDWIGFYYPNGTIDTSSYKIQGGFDSFEECDNWIDEQNQRNTNPNSEWECGRNCKKNKSLDVYICEETI